MKSKIISRRLKRSLALFLAFSFVALSLLGNGVIAVNATENDTQIRNLAYRRAGYQSSAYNANETVQLVTDGIIGDDADEANMMYEFSHQYGNESRFGNVKFLFDNDDTTDWETYHTESWVQVKLPRKTVLRWYTLTSGNADWSKELYAESWELMGSNDGVNFRTIDTQSNQTFADNHTTKWYRVGANTTAYTYYRLNMKAKSGSDRIYMGGFALYDADMNSLLAPYSENVFEFTSVWMSAGNQEEWIYIDLGEDSELTEAKIHWGSMYATKYEVQVSDDAETWTTAATKDDGSGGTETLSLENQTGRYVRLLLKETDPDNLAYIVKEFEVYGTNDLNYTGEVDELPAPEEDGTQVLSGGHWKIARALEVDPVTDTEASAEDDSDAADEIGKAMASADYDDAAWLPAIVPGTVLTSYKSAGAVADPNYADQQFCISDSYFKSNFWYRNHFIIPQENSGKRVFINFGAINWKAEVYFNGQRLGNIRGGFTRAQFELTDYVNYGGENYLAVLIYKNTDPGTAHISTDSGPGTMGGVFGNSGEIGLDAPTYSAALGWDWIPTVRDRAIGIYNEVSLTYTEDVQVVDPWMITEFERDAEGGYDLTKAKLNLKTEIGNPSDGEVTAVVTGTVEEAPEIRFEKEVQIPAGSTVEVDLGEVEFENPEVWWPNTYGDQPLYTAVVSASVGGAVSDTSEFQFGVREFDYYLDESDITDRNGFNNGENLALYCNGVKIICKGGNWGLEDQDLNVDAEKYDEKIRMHKDLNFNMIRLWGGQTNDPELYKACDKYGILIWDDFFLPGCWLYNPADNQMFIDNAADKIKHYRYHASLALYCGENESYPEVMELEVAMRALTGGMEQLVTHPDYAQYSADDDSEQIVGIKCLDGTRHYIPNSGDYPAAVDGPHQAKQTKFYFTNTASNQFTSERGMPNIPVAETMREIFPEENLWPLNDMWALHDFAQAWNTNGEQYMKDLYNYGDYNSFEEFVSHAQMQAYEKHKAMYEGAFASDTNGLLMWMSNPAWTSLMWQAYDYYHDVNGGYYGIKTACQPINLIWNPVNNNMHLNNATASELVGAKAIAEVYDLNGDLVYAKSETIDMPADSQKIAFTLEFPADTTSLQFIKTRVESADGEKLGENFYWHNIYNYEDYTALGELENVDLTANTEYAYTDRDGYRHYTVYVENTSSAPALLTRLKVLDDATGERVLPTFYEDNYFSLMPGELKIVDVSFKESKLNGSQPRFELEGFNVNPAVIGEEPYGSLYISDPKFTNDSEASGSLEPGEYTASVDIYAGEDTEIKLALTEALYLNDNGEEVLIDSAVTEVDQAARAGETITVSAGGVTVPKDADIKQYTLKTFVWNGMDEMNPIKEVTELRHREISPAVYLPKNIALGADVTAQDSEPDKIPEYLVDGNSSTRWASAGYVDNNYIEIDLKDVYSVSSIGVSWESAYAKSYTVEVSADGEEYTQIENITDSSGGNVEFTFDPVNVRYVRITMTERGTGWGYSIYDISVNSASEPSLALGASVYATAYDRAAELYTPEKIVDGDASTRWATMEAEDDQHIIIDLKEPKTFSSIYLIWEAAFGRKYTIEVSDDGESYTPVVTQENGTGGTDVYNIEPTTARYIKINMTERGTGWGYSIYEFSIYE